MKTVLLAIALVVVAAPIAEAKQKAAHKHRIATATNPVCRGVRPELCHPREQIPTSLAEGLMKEIGQAHTMAARGAMLPSERPEKPSKQMKGIKPENRPYLPRAGDIYSGEKGYKGGCSLNRRACGELNGEIKR